MTELLVENKKGRPTLYSPEINDLAQEYLCLCEDTEIARDSGQRTEYKLNVKLPTVEGLSVYLNVSRDTIYEWAKHYPEFSDTLDELKARQADKLINQGLAGNYNSTIAKLMLSSNHGMREKSDVTSNEKDINVVGFQFVRNENNSSENNSD